MPFYAYKITDNNEIKFPAYIVPQGVEKAVLGMGQVAGLIEEELTAEQIIDGIMAEYQETVKELADL